MIRKTYHIDFETFSRADLVDVGAGRYARDPSTRVLCLAISTIHPALDATPKPAIWIPPQDRAAAYALTDYTEEEAVIADREVKDMVGDARMGQAWVAAHNAYFEFAIWNNVMTRHGFTKLPASAMKCTALMARRACIPSSLEKCGAYLGLDAQKDQRGKTLIKQWSMPQKPTKKSGHDHEWVRHIKDDPEGFDALLSYCRQDVIVETKIHHALRLFDREDWQQDIFACDLDVNERGFPVDIKALQRAQKIIEEHGAVMAKRFQQITGFSHTQREKVLGWMQANGYRGTDMQGDTIKQELATNSKLPHATREALSLKHKMSFAAVSKISTMLECAGPDDNRVRHTLLCHGASTGRWSSKLVQQQNFKRPEFDGTEDAFTFFRNGVSVKTLEWVYGPIIGLLANCIRHFIHDIGGPADDDWSPLESVDYAAIEARIVAWLAGQEDALQEYRNGVDRYKGMAARIYRVPLDLVTKAQRFVGKNTVLGCGYGMGASKFQSQCAGFGVKLEADECELAVSTYRDAHPEIVSLWYAVEAAAKNAILYPGQKFACRKVSLFCAETAGRMFLFIKLPSGRHLAYPEPRIEDVGGRRSITFYGQLPMSAQWGRVTTYGGKLVENITQGVAADCMGIGLLNAHTAGYEVIMLVHDEAVRTTRGHGTLEGFQQELLRMPEWADGLPLATEGERIQFYKK